MKRVTIDVEEEDYSELRKLLIDEKITVADFIRKCIKDKIKKKK